MDRFGWSIHKEPILHIKTNSTLEWWKQALTFVRRRLDMRMSGRSIVLSVTVTILKMGCIKNLN
jgi:hypothetical protein